MQVPSGASIIYKGSNPDIDSYSAFFDNGKLSHTEMEEFLRSHGVTDTYICGIAYDVCVGESAGQPASRSVVQSSHWSVVHFTHQPQLNKGTLTAPTTSSSCPRSINADKLPLHYRLSDRLFDSVPPLFSDVKLVYEVTWMEAVWGFFGTIGGGGDKFHL